jgi:hypothetical protein
MPPEWLYNFRHYGPVPLSFDPVRHLRWTYQGWQGQVYTRQYPENKFVQDCLGEYCQYEYQGELLFRTVGNDVTFYCPTDRESTPALSEPDPRRLSDMF